jgi:hypothetical protein
MNGRVYDPVMGRFLSADPLVHSEFGSNGLNRYAYAFNSPLVFIDPDGRLPVLAIIAIGAVIYASANLAIQASNGEINSFWDGAKAFGSGLVVGGALTAGIIFGLGVPFLGAVIKGAGLIYSSSLIVGGVSNLIRGAVTGDWTPLRNMGRIFAGNFYLDGNRNFFGQVMQGLGRFSWELPQNTIGHSYSQLRNAFGSDLRVDYFGGATFVTGENKNQRWGVSIGSYMNISIGNQITGNFDNWVTGNPLYMHEYGHSFDSQIFGWLYLPFLGLPSLISAATARPLPGGITTHSLRWYEMKANRHAARYFGRYYGINWMAHEPPRGRFPRRR